MRPRQLEIKPVFTGPFLFDALAIFLDDYATRNFNVTRVVVEVGEPLVP